MTDYMKKNGIPIAFASTIVSAILYNSGAPFAGLLILLSFVLQPMCFGFLSSVKSSGRRGVYKYIVVLAVLALVTAMMLNGMGDGQESDALNISKSLLIFIDGNFFVGSVVFYFTQVMYRSVFLFLLTLIPFMLQVNKYSAVNNVFVFLNLALFIALRIQFYQVRDGGMVRSVIDRSYTKNIAFFVMTVMLLAFMLPKPNLSTSELNLGSAIYLEKLKDNTLDEGELGKGKVLYKVAASHPLYLRRQSFDMYKDNYWESSKQYGNTGYSRWALGRENHDYNEYLQILKRYAEKNPEFKKKFHLSALPNSVASAETIRITLDDLRSYAVLTVNNVVDVTNMSANVKTYGTAGNDVFMSDGQYLGKDDFYFVQFYPEQIQLNPQVIAFIQKFDKETYNELNSEILLLGEQDNQDISESHDMAVIQSFSGATAEALEFYNSSDQNVPPQLKNLALAITQGLTSDYDKAKALETYFQDNGYKYDKTFRPDKGQEDIESFVFKNKRGICTDYATAMTLMARAVGLPAKYVEGYLVTEQSGNGTYLCKDTDAHAFTEVFISGYGWMTFDATVSSSEDPDNILLNYATNKQNLVIAGALAIAILAVGIGLFQPLKELFFRIWIRTLSNERAVVALLGRVKRIASRKSGISLDAVTARMIAKQIDEQYQVDLSSLVDAFEKACYGEKKLTSLERQQAYRVYLKYRKAVQRTKKGPVSGIRNTAGQGSV